MDGAPFLSMSFHKSEGITKKYLMFFIFWIQHDSGNGIFSFFAADDNIVRKDDMKAFPTLTLTCAAGLLLFAMAAPREALSQQKQQAKPQENRQIKQQSADKDGERKWHLSVGFTVGCFWWNPVWQKYTGDDLSEGFIPYKYKINPNAIYGPLLGFTINERWSLTWSFQYGSYLASTKTIYYNPLYFPFPIPNTFKFRAVKMDSDLLTQAVVWKYARLFFGLRYQGYQYQEKFLGLTSTKVKYHSLALGFGSAFTVPMGRAMISLISSYDRSS